MRTSSRSSCHPVQLVCALIAVASLLTGCGKCCKAERAAEPTPISVDAWKARSLDWRNGAVVYQVIVDRFAPSENLDAKRGLYPAPKKLRSWDETPKRGDYVKEAEVWSHEIDFWGGDFASTRGKLDYVQNLGADVLYLNPIHLAYTNHKYDAQDYFKVSPEYGTRDDVKSLAEAVHARKMRFVLDGVFNHMGRTSPWFQDAMANPQSPWRDWYYIGPQYKLGYRAWVNVANLPEVNLENPKVRARLWGDKDSVIQGYLRDGVDGWRLDVAFDIGPQYLDELTRSAHSARAGSLVVGEIWNYPEGWFPSVDALMNMTLRELILRTSRGEMPAPMLGRNVERMVADAGIEPILKSWLILDNHDTPRLATSIPDAKQRHFAQALQFTLPGSPVLYYGTELGMTGGDDPEQRAPMRWDLVRDDNADLAWTRKLLSLRRESPSLRYGDFRLLESQTTLAFLRKTDRAKDTVVVVANAGKEPAKEALMLRDSMMMSYTAFYDAFTNREFHLHAGILPVEIAPGEILVLRPAVEQGVLEYTPYKRVM